MRTLRNVVITIASVAVIGFGVNAFAHGRGMGGGGGCGNYGADMSDRGGYGQGYGNQLNKEEYKQFEQKREAFFKETQDLRANLFEKERDLQNELAKDEPDAAKASGLQKEISDLQSQFDQKRINHMVEMRKLNPNAGRGFMSQGPRMGYGKGGGHCWQ
ncbi:MAG: periplasmic heavy metal sensor [Thermodesulfobacteriota bacterium]|nr:periplasmic heavy metal sensor [Thermodesulfobacteriota bacterium]